MYPDNNDTVRRWIAERENANAQIELARMKECCNLLLSQNEPVESLGVDRNALKVLLDFVRHHDLDRLRRDAEKVRILNETMKDDDYI